MKDVDLYLKVRHAVRIEGLSERAAARRFGIDPRTVNKMMKFSVPPGYIRKKPPAKPKLDPFISVIDRILEDDKSRPKKQQHTAKRIFERLRAAQPKRLTLPDGGSLDVTIRAGMQEGQILRLRGKGAPSLGEGKAGDALVEISINPHRFFARQGDDIHVDLPVTLAEAVVGA